MRAFYSALIAVAAQAKWEGYVDESQVKELMDLELTLEEQEELYYLITGDYCQENVHEPLCMHVKEEREHFATLEEWTAPELGRQRAYCTRFPENCDSANKLKVNPETRFIVDKEGRTVLLHGINAIYKVDPYIPLTGDDEWDSNNSLNAKDIEDLVSWGMNFVRLGVMWEGVEREAGKYDDAYLDRVEALINKMGEAGIYTLVDAHQDVYARYMCGEGIPDFYAQEVIGPNPSCINPIADVLLKGYYNSIGQCNDMNDFGWRVDDNGDFLIEDCLQVMFANYYNTKQGVTGFGALFSNAYNMNDKFVSFWNKSTHRFAGNPYVVGYDPLNEPFPANKVKDPTLRIPGVMDRKHLQPTYAKIHENAI